MFFFQLQHLFQIIDLLEQIHVLIELLHLLWIINNNFHFQKNKNSLFLKAIQSRNEYSNVCLKMRHCLHLTPSLLCILHAVCRGTNDHMRVCSLLWLFLRKLLSDFNKTARDGQKHNTVYIEPRICCNCSELFGLEFFYE